MHYKQIDQTPKTFILIFETGDELAEGLNRFAIEQQLSAVSFKAVGALSVSVRRSYFGRLLGDRNHRLLCDANR
jgi:uncharacterized protein